MVLWWSTLLVVGEGTDVSLSRRLASTQCFRRRRATSACSARRTLAAYLSSVVRRCLGRASRSATYEPSRTSSDVSWKSLRGAAQRAQPTGGRSPSVEPLDSCLCQGIPNTYDNTSSLQQRLHQSTVQMPVGYVVSPNGRIGAELRVARDTHELVATGTSARLGILLPYHTTTTLTTGRSRSTTSWLRRATAPPSV